MLPLFIKGKACCLVFSKEIIGHHRHFKFLKIQRHHVLEKSFRKSLKGIIKKSPTFPNINETVFHIYLYFNNKEHDIKDIFIDSVAFLPTIEHFFAFLTKSSMMKIMKARLSNWKAQSETFCFYFENFWI